VAREHMQLADVHLRDVIDALLEIGGPSVPLELVEDIGMRDRHVDALEVEQIAQVLRGTVCDYREHTEIVAVVQCLCELGGKTGEGPFEQAACNGDRPGIGAGHYRSLT